jgi:hypothetical protein
MIGHPWMSMFVGAVMPRQETAFASDERKTNPPAKQAMAVQINRKRRICFVRCDIKYPNATLSSRLSQGAKISGKCLSDAINTRDETGPSAWPPNRIWLDGRMKRS